MYRKSRNLSIIFVGLCLILLPVIGHAAEWSPSGSIKLQIGHGAGGSTDILTRVLSAEIEKTTGWNIIVENKPGGAGITMLSGLMHKKPDGQSVGVVVNMPVLMNLVMRGDKLPFNLDSFDYLGTITNAEVAIVARGDAPFNDFQGLLDHVKATGEPMGFDAKPQQMILKAISKETGVKMKLVSHKSGAAQLQGLLGKHLVSATMSGEHIKYLKRGDLKMITVLNKGRHGYAPETKSLVELGYNYYVDPYYSILAPKGLPEGTKTALAKALEDALQSDSVKEALMNIVKVEPNNLGPEGTKKMYVDGLSMVTKLVEATK